MAHAADDFRQGVATGTVNTITGLGVAAAKRSVSPLPPLPDVLLDQLPLLGGVNRKIDAFADKLRLDSPQTTAGVVGNFIGSQLPTLPLAFVGGGGAAAESIAPELSAVAGDVTAEVEAEVAATATRGWQPGDPHYNLTARGTEPAWSTVKRRYWINRSLDASPEYIASDQLRMAEGKPPIDPFSGKSIELEHILPQRTGDPLRHRSLLEVTPLEHSFFDRYRFVRDPNGLSFQTFLFDTR
jgi:hypothetical protein